MIIDRIQKDVDEAIRLRNEKIKFDPITMQPINLEELTEEELEHLQKGTFNAEDLNRIENKQAELKNLFNKMGYFPDTENKTDWTTDDMFTKADFQRIISNHNSLRALFYTYSNTPDTPGVSFHYEDINALEKILVDMEIIANTIKKDYKLCGMLYCGGVEI